VGSGTAVGSTGTAVGSTGAAVGSTGAAVGSAVGVVQAPRTNTAISSMLIKGINFLDILFLLEISCFFKAG
jgi:hypothetical protein